MTDKTSTASGILSTVVFYLLVTLLGYFVYGGLNGALGTLLLVIVVSIVSVVSIVPFVGVFIQYYLLTRFVFPYIYSITGLYSTWVTDVILWTFMVIGCIVWISVIIIIFGLFYNRRS